MSGRFLSANATLAEDLDTVASTMNMMWVLFCGILVVAMQLGFAMLEVGSCREAHRMTVLAKNVLDSAVSCIGFAVVGTQLCPQLLTSRGHGPGPAYHYIFYYWGMGATTVTICSGSMAERAHIFAYLCYALVMSAIIFPILAESAWGHSGLLHYEFYGRVGGGQAFHDLAGSGVVHLVGGVAALVGNSFLGRRILRNEAAGGEPEQLLVTSGGQRPDFIGDVDAPSEVPVVCPDGGWTRRFDDEQCDHRELQACNYLQAMGMFTLWFGWYGFNTGMTLFYEASDSSLVGLVAWNTTLAAAGGGIGTFTWCYCGRTVLDVGFVCNGVIAGLVSITAACDVATEGLSFATGLIVGLLLYPLASYLTRLLRVDDPVDAIPVHLVGGLVGVLVVGIARPDCTNASQAHMDLSSKNAYRHFCDPDHSTTTQLMVQLWGAFVLTSVTGVVCLLLFGAFAVSEYARSVEGDHLERAEKLFESSSPSEQTSETAANAWKELARQSPVVKRILLEHGWTEAADFKVTALSTRLPATLRETRGRMYETALEGRNYRWHPLAFIGRRVGCIWLFRKLAFARLRIAPHAEVSGLGAVGTDGGLGLALVLKSMHKDYYQKNEESKAEIASRMHELSTIVSSQDVLLQHLASRSLPMKKRSRSRGGSHVGSPATSSHAELLSPGGSGQSGEVSFLAEVPENGVATPQSNVRFQIAPHQREDVSLSSRGSSRDDKTTVSNDSCGNISPMSEGSNTPPPTVFGQMGAGARSARSANRQRPDAALQDLAQAALAIARALESQQEMLSTIQRRDGSRSSRSSASSKTNSDPGRSRATFQPAQSSQQPPPSCPPDPNPPGLARVSLL